MRRWLGVLLRVTARVVVGFFPAVALLFVILIEPWANIALKGMLILTALLLAVLWWHSRRDPALRQALWIAGLFLVVTIACGTTAALFFARLTWQDLWARAVHATAVPPSPRATEPPLPSQQRLWHEAAPEWLAQSVSWDLLPLPAMPWWRAGFWEVAAEPQWPYTRFLPGGAYQVVVPQPLQAALLLAPWGRAPSADVTIRAQLRWEGLSRVGVWGVVCRAQNATRFYAFTVRGDDWAAIWKHTPDGAVKLAPWTQWRLPEPERSRGEPPVGVVPAPTAPAPAAVTPTVTPTPGLPRVQGRARLTAVCRGRTLQLYVDGLLAAEAEDPDPYVGGAVGLWAVAPPTGDWQVTWLDFDVYLDAPSR